MMFLFLLHACLCKKAEKTHFGASASHTVRNTATDQCAVSFHLGITLPFLREISPSSSRGWSQYYGRYETPTLQNELFRVLLHRQAYNRDENVMQICLTHIHIFMLALKPGACQPGSKNAFSVQILNPLNTLKRTELAWSMHAEDVLTSSIPSFFHEHTSLCVFSPFCSPPRARA